MKYIGAIFSRILMVVLLLSFSVAYAQEKNFIDRPYVEVKGMADTLVTPDLIYLGITLSEKDVKNKSSVEELETSMLGSLKELGIDIDTKLTVSDLLSDYKNYWLKKTDIVKTKSYELEVGSAAAAARVLGALEDLGISNIHVARLEHSHMKVIENEVRMRAVLDARMKAESYVTPLKQGIGEAIHIFDLAFGSLGGRTEGLDEVVVAGYGISRKKLQQPDEAVTFRKIKVSKSVNVVFVLR